MAQVGEELKCFFSQEAGSTIQQIVFARKGVFGGQAHHGIRGRVSCILFLHLNNSSLPPGFVMQLLSLLGLRVGGELRGRGWEGASYLTADLVISVKALWVLMPKCWS